MLEDLEALIALRDHDTMTKAAASLRVSQSAISKRVASLSRELGVELLRPVGRRVQLTPFAAGLVERTAPLLSELKRALRPEDESVSGELTLVVCDSVLSSWGPPLLAALDSALPEVRLRVSTRRTTAAIERLHAGEAMLGLLAGAVEAGDGLVVQGVAGEPMVVVHGPEGDATAALEAPLTLMAIERHDATWHDLEPQLKALEASGGPRLEVGSRLDSFPALVAMTQAGLGEALVPLGTAQAMGVPAARIRRLEGLTRKISLVGRARTLDGALPGMVSATLERLLPDHLPRI
ncbi:MAG: LysR family transcriptional regulator [Myxococcales bacterium]|nr:LysR family transcriptional regulator [Myxococcales bacterium]